MREFIVSWIFMREFIVSFISMREGARSDYGPENEKKTNKNVTETHSKKAREGRGPVNEQSE